jgi:hypothetical protein
MLSIYYSHKKFYETSRVSNSLFYKTSSLTFPSKNFFMAYLLFFSIKNCLQDKNFPGPDVSKPTFASLTDWSNKLECFPQTKIFCRLRVEHSRAKQRNYRSRTNTIESGAMFVTLNGPNKPECFIALMCKGFPETNTLAYWAYLKVTEKIKSCEYGTSWKCYKKFTVVIWQFL